MNRNNFRHKVYDVLKKYNSTPADVSQIKLLLDDLLAETDRYAGEAGQEIIIMDKELKAIKKKLGEKITTQWSMDIKYINSGLRSCIKDHGSITKEMITSASKRILQTMKDAYVQKRNNDGSNT